MHTSQITNELRHIRQEQMRNKVLNRHTGASYPRRLIGQPCGGVGWRPHSLSLQSSLLIECERATIMVTLRREVVCACGQMFTWSRVYIVICDRPRFCPSTPRSKQAFSHAHVRSAWYPNRHRHSHNHSEDPWDYITCATLHPRSSIFPGFPHLYVV